MIDLISRVNPNYQKSIDAVSGAKPAEKTEKPADETVKENVEPTSRRTRTRWRRTPAPPTSPTPLW